MFGKRLSRALAVTTVASLVLATAAFADTITITNTVLVNTNVTKAPGTTGTGYVRVDTTNGTPSDDANGCNATGSASLTITLESDNAGVTLDDDTVVIAGCGVDVPFTYAVAAGASGSATISAIALSGGRTDGTRTYLTTDTLVITISAPACTTPAQPTITATGGTGPNAANWYTAAPTLSSASAGVQWATAVNGGAKSAFSSTVPTLGTGTTIVYAKAVSGTCESTEASATFKVDPNAPTIADNGIFSGTAGTGTWYTTPVEHEFEASEPLIESGLPASMTNPFTGSTGATSEGTDLTISSGPVSDVAGNTNPGITSLSTYDVDLSNPYNVAFVGGPAAGSSHFFGSVPAAPTCTADDDISLLASCVVTDWSDTVGSHTMTATATDNAGRTATATRSYSVLAWTLNGFYSPVDMNSALNVVKAGSTVPLKFEIFAGSTEFTTIDKIASFKVGKVPCGALDTTLTDDIENYSTGQTVLRYDSTGGQFIQNWQVPKSSASAPAGSCYTATLTTLDGSSLTAYFKTK